MKSSLAALPTQVPSLCSRNHQCAVDKPQHWTWQHCQQQCNTCCWQHSQMQNLILSAARCSCKRSSLELELIILPAIPHWVGKPFTNNPRPYMSNPNPFTSIPSLPERPPTHSRGKRRGCTQMQAWLDNRQELQAVRECHQSTCQPAGRPAEIAFPFSQQIRKEQVSPVHLSASW